jgi:cobalt-zinc-cadmium efflux system membrane fusion protein
MVPLDALQRAKGQDLVFVQLAADRYEAHAVRAGARRDGLVEILEGLEPGTPVATRGSFLLKTEVLKGSIGAGCCEVE